MIEMRAHVSQGAWAWLPVSLRSLMSYSLHLVRIDGTPHFRNQSEISETRSRAREDVGEYHAAQSFEAASSSPSMQLVWGNETGAGHKYDLAQDVEGFSAGFDVDGWCSAGDSGPTNMLDDLLSIDALVDEDFGGAVPGYQCQLSSQNSSIFATSTMSINHQESALTPRHGVSTDLLFDLLFDHFHHSKIKLFLKRRWAILSNSLRTKLLPVCLC